MRNLNDCKDKGGEYDVCYCSKCNKERDKFLKHLKSAENRIKTWPLWAQNILRKIQ